MTGALFEAPGPPPVPEPFRHTEASILDLLDARYGRTYANGSYESLRYIGARHVRTNPNFSSPGDRIIDYLAVDAWKGTGPADCPVIGFEVKVSRSDYLTEIRDLSKSEPFRSICSEWYMVVSDKSIVRDDLPDGWGLMVADRTRIRCVRKSSVNPAPDLMPRAMLGGLLRQVAMQHRTRALAAGA